MTFNCYVWSLYRDSDHGRQMINQAFPKFSRYVTQNGAETLRLNTSIPVFAGPAVNPFQDSKAVYTTSLRTFLANDAVFGGLSSLIDVEKRFEQLVEDGGFVEWDDDENPGRVLWTGIGGEGNEIELVDLIAEISSTLHWRYPDWFAPYYFSKCFNRLADICDTFEIPLPPIPGKLEKRARPLYYLAVNQALQEFRSRHGLTAKELNAFLYDFAPHYLMDEDDSELPSPQRAWFIMAGVGTTDDFEFLDNATTISNSFWRGHRDARRGDIALVWCCSPRAYLHTIWRIVEDGFDDPFAHWYSLVKLGYPNKLAPIKLADMKAHPILAASPMVRAHFQGCAGQYFRDQDYAAVLEVLAEKGGDVSLLPCLEVRVEDHGQALMNERDVERHLIEPLLQRLGYVKKDWTRQLRLRMGRGDRVFPDYVIGADSTFGQERGDLVVEAKYRIATRSDLQEAWIQGRSYALRLEAKWLVLAALEGVWLLSVGNGFRLEGVAPCRWGDLDKPEIFFPIERSIGKKHLGKRRSA